MTFYQVINRTFGALLFVFALRAFYTFCFILYVLGEHLMDKKLIQTLLKATALL